MSKKKIIILVLLIFIILFAVFYFIHMTTKQECGQFHEKFECQSKLWCKSVSNCGKYKAGLGTGHAAVCANNCVPIWGALNFLTAVSQQKINKPDIFLERKIDNHIGYCQSNNDCLKTGCSGTLCQSKFDQPAATTCEWHDSYQCYQNAECSCVNSKCQFTDKDKIKNCINRHNN